MKCVVTGGAGFIGSHVSELLLREGNQVSIIDDLSAGRRENVAPEAEFFRLDVQNERDLDAVFEGADVVFHLAAWPRIQPSFELPIEHEKINVLGSIQVFQAAKRRKVPRIVYSASSSCYGTPSEIPTTEQAPIQCLSPYALQKYTAEQYLFMLGGRYGVEVVSLRYFNVYGPRSFDPNNPLNAYSPVMGIFKEQRAQGKALTITGNGEQRRDFVHVFDVARANLAAATTQNHGSAYNIGSGTSYSINEIARYFGEDHVYIPERKGEAMITHADITLAEKKLNWSPEISLEQGMDCL